MLVKSIMTAPVITIRLDDSLADAVALMNLNKLSGLAVVDAEAQLCGIVSEGDLLRRIELDSATKNDHWWSILYKTDGLAEAYKHANGRKVSDVMTLTPVTIGRDGTVADAAHLMEKHNVKRLPVMDGGKLVGMLSRSDFVRALGRFISPACENRATSDGEIKERIQAEIANQKWSSDCRIKVDVRDGRAMLSGFVPSSEHESAAKVAAENVVGVVNVENRLELSQPIPIYTM